MSFKKYQNFEMHQNLALFLTKLEESCSLNDFYEKLLDQQQLDPEGFKVGSVLIPGEKFPRAVVIGNHAIIRGKKRLGMSPEKLMQTAIYYLQNPFVGVEVCSHPVVLDGDKIISFDGDKCCSSVVIFTDKHNVFVFQVGFNFVLVKTVWNTWRGKFHTWPSNVVICIKGNGSVAYRRHG